jgi:excinuclease UvrABC nuclease subunit
MLGVVPVAFQSVGFDAAAARETLRALPEKCAVFALYGEAAHAEPYIGRTPNLRGRLERLLIPSPKHPKRLQLAGRVRRIEWRLTGSDFESLLLQFDLLHKVYGAKALERMHLGAPSFVRFLGGNPYPRVTVTNRPSQREAEWAYGPFASRAAAERFADEALKLFLLRRCTDDLNPDPSHPGCVYSEMKMCLAPCYKGCSDERYAEEAAGVERFLATRGESKLVQLKASRDEASANLEFETAAALHSQAQKAEAVRALAPELVRPLSQLRAVVLQASAGPDEVAVFLYERGRLCGPVAFSTLGMRIQNEQSGSSSLFAQPLALEAVVEDREQEDRDQAPGTRDQNGREQGVGSRGQGTGGSPTARKAARGLLEARMEGVLEELMKAIEAPNAVVRQGHLALLKRWYYRPEVKRPGEICFPNDEGAWPVRAMLRSVGRIAAKSLTATGA